MNKFEKISNLELLKEVQRRIEMEEGEIGIRTESGGKILYLEDLKTGEGRRLDMERNEWGEWVNKEWLKSLVN